MNHRGSAVITGMIAALSVGVVSAVILQQSQVTDKQTRIPRIKSSMMMVETQLNEAFNQSIITQPCVSGVAGCLELNHSVLDAMRVEIAGAQCGTPPCGVSIENRSFAGGVFAAQIIYNGTEVSIAPVNISLTLSQNDNWTTVGSSCPDAEPLLLGFNQDGSRICGSLPADCGPGMYVSSIDPMSLTSGGLSCTNFPTDVSCGPNQIMIGFQWTGGSAGVPQCANFLNPFNPTVLNDPTAYAYSPPISAPVSSWPTTTLAPPNCDWFVYAGPTSGGINSNDYEIPACGNQCTPGPGCPACPAGPACGGGNGVTPPEGQSQCMRCGSVINIAGTCGSSAGVPSATAPLANRCSTGSATVAADAGANWSWSCNGMGAGGNASCLAPKIISVPGMCMCFPSAGGGASYSNPIGYGTLDECNALRAVSPPIYSCTPGYDIGSMTQVPDCYVLANLSAPLDVAQVTPLGICDPFPAVSGGPMCTTCNTQCMGHGGGGAPEGPYGANCLCNNGTFQNCL